MSERQLDFAEAIREALRNEMLRDKSIVVFGEDVGKFGGLFGCTKGLQKEFGEERVRDTPISEAAIIGAAVGAALTGLRPVAEIEFMDFIGCAKVPAVVRVPCGSRYPVASGAAQHSQCLEAWFMHTPGLKVVTPSTPYDAKGLLITALRGEDPVLFVEHKLLYYARRVRRLEELYPTLIGHVPMDAYAIPFGQADVKRKGDSVTIVATMMMMHKALKAAEVLSKQGVSAEVVDPRTLVPLDKATIIESVRKTGKVIVVSEDCKTAGVSSEIVSVLMEEAFDYLDAPVKRVCAPDSPIPYSPVLERVAIPQEENIIQAALEAVGKSG